jgi:hypothetical protein
MPLARINDVKAADPGIGFTLSLSKPLPSLRTNITITDEQGLSYTSEVFLFNAINDTELVFVVPFGDQNYASSKVLNFRIELYTPYDETASFETILGSVVGESGVFNFNTKVPTAHPYPNFPKNGDMLQSPDGNYVGVYQKDGNFCVYEAYTTGQQGLNAVYATQSAVGEPTFFQVVQDGSDLTINIQKSDNSVVSSCKLKMFVFGDININASGQLCLGNVPLIFTRYPNS